MRTTKQSTNKAMKRSSDWLRVDGQSDEEIRRASRDDRDAAPLVDSDWFRRARIVRPEPATLTPARASTARKHGLTPRVAAVRAKNGLGFELPPLQGPTGKRSANSMRTRISRTDQVLVLVQAAADQFEVFKRRGPGEGNTVTNEAMKYLNGRVAAELGHGVVERTLGRGQKQSVDFYIPEESTVIEVEFSLSNPYPYLEKDAFKALLARDAGHEVRTLILVGDPGCAKRMSAPAPRAIVALLRRLDLEVRIVELRGSSATSAS